MAPEKSTPTAAVALYAPAREAELVLSPGGEIIARRFALGSAAAEVKVYPGADRRRIVEQLILLLNGFYVHQTEKKARYGFDAAQALELLRGVIDGMTDAEFHESVVEVVARTRDRHLTFWGRSPLGGGAVLPFDIERYWDGSAERYVVTKIKGNRSPAGHRPRSSTVG